MKKLMITTAAFAAALALNADVVSSSVVGYSAKEQLNTKPTGIITFQWDAVSGDTVKLNGFVQPSVTSVYSYDGDAMIENWHLNAPKIQIRTPAGGYITRYYCADAYNNDSQKVEAGWATDGGDLDTTTTLSLGGGAWVSCASADCSFTTSGAVATEETAVGGDSTITMLCGGAFPIAFKLNDTNAVVWTCSPGKSYEGDAMIENWHLNAPKIQVRTSAGGYTTRYYCSDAYNNDTQQVEAGWATDGGDLDTTTTVDVGGGFWLNQPNGDKKIYVTVKNPVK